MQSSVRLFASGSCSAQNYYALINVGWIGVTSISANTGVKADFLAAIVTAIFVPVYE
jgi:hypothetical protein